MEDKGLVFVLTLILVPSAIIALLVANPSLNNSSYQYFQGISNNKGAK